MIGERRRNLCALYSGDRRGGETASGGERPLRPWGNVSDLKGKGSLCRSPRGAKRRKGRIDKGKFRTFLKFGGYASANKRGGGVLLIKG